MEPTTNSSQTLTKLVAHFLTSITLRRSKSTVVANHLEFNNNKKRIIFLKKARLNIIIPISLQNKSEKVKQKLLLALNST